jgi:hypothetical protein
MATKKPTNISKHKTGTTRRVVKPATGPQAFDIIPPSRVKPSITSRPVITSTQPPVADNTLTTPPTAPTLQLKHKELTLEPSKSAEDLKAKPEGSVATPSEPGVSVGDLIAKREKAKTEEPEPAADKQEPQETVVEEKSAEVTPVEEPEPKAEPESEATKSSANEQTSEPPKVEDVKPPVADGAKSAGEDVPEDDFMRALRDDHNEPSESQEHSPALKQAIQDLDEKDGRPHHELYGGKPVIVIHREHGAKSALLWILWFIICVGLALLVVNLLLDADIIQTDYNVPHTDFL